MTPTFAYASRTRNFLQRAQKSSSLRSLRAWSMKRMASAFNVDHGELIKPAFGYRIDYQGRSVVLSGDTRVSQNLIRFSKGADVLFHEVAAAKAENLSTSDAARRIIGHHTTPEDAGRVFNRLNPN